MITLFDEPPRVTLNLAAYPFETETQAALLLGFVAEPPVKAHPNTTVIGGLLCLGDGRIELVPVEAFTIDYRYSVETDRFIDLSYPKPDQEA